MGGVLAPRTEVEVGAVRTKAKMGQTVSCVDVAAEFAAASRICAGADLVPLWQAVVKPIVAVTMDRLVGRTAVHRGKAVMWANGQDLIRPHLKYCRFPANREGVKTGGECMLDVSIFEPSDADPFKPLATAESEAAGRHWPSEGQKPTSETVDYLWDLYKLLQVPSPLRLFVCRVLSKEERWKEVQTWSSDLVRLYQDRLAVGDRVFVIVLPTAGRDYPKVQCHGWQRTGAILQDLGTAPVGLS